MGCPVLPPYRLRQRHETSEASSKWQHRSSVIWSFEQYSAEDRATGLTDNSRYIGKLVDRSNGGLQDREKVRCSMDP